MNEDLLVAIRANLFPPSHKAIEDWASFPWHKEGRGTAQPHSSQALAIDVFGSLQAHPLRHRVIPALLKYAFPDLTWRSLSWEVRLEVKVDGLGEPTPTQLDALLVGDAELVTVESKFCEAAAGACSQPNPIASGPNKGLIQCNGNYETQVNPVNGTTSRCALSGKGIQYWTFIPELFEMDAEADQRPCFFRGDSYQLMRNVVASQALAHRAGKVGHAMLVYVDGPRFPMSQHVQEPKSAWNALLERLRPEHRPRVAALTYQSLIQAANDVAAEDTTLRELADWFLRKKLPAGLKACEGVNR